jgi:membrane protein DedA with SNARE-associated domain
VSISNLISTYGYLAVFVIVAAESLGLPLPGETALITAGIYAGHTHRLNPWLIFLVASAAAVIGDNIGYWIGDKGGYRLARRYGPKVGLDETKLKIARYLFDRHGSKVVFFGRFVSVLRTYAAFLAGTSKMRWRRFLPANAAGGVVWAAIYTFASYLGGHALQQASGIVNWILIGAAVIAIAAAVVLVRHHTGKLAAEAEAAYPGPLKLPRPRANRTLPRLRPSAPPGPSMMAWSSPRGRGRRCPGEHRRPSALTPPATGSTCWPPRARCWPSRAPTG